MYIGEHSEGPLRDLFGADFVLPEQFWGPQTASIHLTGERALMWAVLADGIDCYRRNAHSTSAQQRIEFKEAERWVLSTDWDWPFSFVNLCEAFGLSPTGVRGALQHWKEQRGQARPRRRRFRPPALHAA